MPLESCSCARMAVLSPKTHFSKVARVPLPAALFKITIFWSFPPSSFQFVTSPKKIFFKFSIEISLTPTFLLTIGVIPTTATL